LVGKRGGGTLEDRLEVVNGLDLGRGWSW
jgi:hypothetical protein